jgi:two-component system LytT family sensor kinase
VGQNWKNMLTAGAPELLHIVGYLTGALLYAMLLVMAARRDGSGDRLTIGTALLGLTWSAGELTTHGLDALQQPFARNVVTAVSYGALGLLAAVVVHSVARGREGDDRGSVSRLTGVIPAVAYLCATTSALMQLFAALTGRPVPWPAALIVLTAGLGVLSIALVVTTRRRPQAKRTLWIAALALFMVSALHLIGFHGTAESWSTELIGHHSSIPLAFAILYQDYRFALADLFLKRAITVLAVVSLVYAAWLLMAPALLGPVTQEVVGALLAAWVVTALVAPWLHRQIAAFVDRVILNRANYRTLLEGLTSTIQRCATPEAVLDHACETLAPALSADRITWRDGVATPSGGNHIPVPTTEEPHFVLLVGPLAGGRRLLSDDVAMLERAGLLAARRIDALRLTSERYERMLHEREIGALATQAELRALRAQINPHFLFNALTTIGYLIQSAPPRAFDTLMRLTTLLRGVLRSEGEFTTLRHERELVDSYLQIERERFEERLRVQIDVPEEMADEVIPSLIVQPLVENAIKHGIANARHGGMVSIAASRLEAPPRLRIAVRNTGGPLTNQASRAGIGLDNVRRRLAHYFGSEATLRLAQDGDGSTLAELVLPLADLEETAVSGPASTGAST